MSEIKSLYNHPKINVAVDCVIFGYDEETVELKILLFKRKINPEAGKWSLMGGFVNPEEDIDDSAERVLKSITGLNNIYLEQVKAFGKHNRDSGGRVISLAYFSLLKFNQLTLAADSQTETAWFPLNNIPDLVFDHREIVATCLHYLKLKVITIPLVFELIPAKFTLVQLEKVYELILNKKIDRRNFRKKIQETGLIIRLHKKKNTEKVKGRPAELFMFDLELYTQETSKSRTFHFI